MITAFPPNFRAGRLRRCPANDHAPASGTSHPRHPVRSPDGLRLWTQFSLKSQSVLRLRTVSPLFCRAFSATWSQWRRFASACRRVAPASSELPDHWSEHCPTSRLRRGRGGERGGPETRTGPRPNSRVTRGHLDSRSGHSVPMSHVSQKLRVLRFGHNSRILRGFRVAKLRRKTSDLCDVFCDNRTEVLTRKPLCLPRNSLGWPSNGPS